jgi:predicted nuclease of restriction endonuclease-like RecB superfamily
LSRQIYEENSGLLPKIVLSFHTPEQAQKVVEKLENMRLNHIVLSMRETLFENEGRTLVLVFKSESIRTSDLLNIMDIVTEVASKEGIKLNHLFNSRLLVAQ